MRMVDAPSGFNDGIRFRGFFITLNPRAITADQTDCTSSVLLAATRAMNAAHHTKLFACNSAMTELFSKCSSSSCKPCTSERQLSIALVSSSRATCNPYSGSLRANVCCRAQPAAEPQQELPVVAAADDGLERVPMNELPQPNPKAMRALNKSQMKVFGTNVVVRIAPCLTRLEWA